MKISVMGIAWYRREDYEKLKKLCADGDTFAPRYDDWLKSAENLVNKLRSEGRAYRKIYIDPDTFQAWCAQRGIEINSQARTRFSAEAAYGDKEAQ